MANLLDVFNDIISKYSEINDFTGPRNDSKFKDLVRSACEICEKAIDMVNQLETFSQNENIDDISTESIRKSSYKNFLDFCSELNIEYPYKYSTNKSENGSDKSMMVITNSRENKIKNYKIKKSLDEELEKLSSTVDQPHVDEEIKRNYYLAMVKKWICLTQDELGVLELEQTLLIKKEQNQESNIIEPSSVPVKTFKPFILTRNSIQSKVFGLGYPSLPTMTVEEFYDKQVAEGFFPEPKPMLINMDENNDGRPNVRRIDLTDEVRQRADEKKSREQELLDADDPEQLERARHFDEFKDMHRRGSGNRMNRS